MLKLRQEKPKRKRRFWERRSEAEVRDLELRPHLVVGFGSGTNRDRKSLPGACFPKC